MIATKLVNSLDTKGRRIRAMGTNTATTRGRTAIAVIAATLTIVLTVDLFGIAPVLADPPGAGDLSRAERVDAVTSGLNLDTAVPATELTGSWDPLPGSAALSELPVALPAEDEEVVALTEGGGSAPVSYRSRTEGEGPIEVDLGGMAVTVEATDEAVTPDSVLLQVADETVTAAAGVTGVLLDVTDLSETPVEDAAVELTVSYADFAGLVGGDWASRLRIMWIPDCDTETIDCSPIPLETVNDLAAQTVTAVVPVDAAESVVFALSKNPAAPATNHGSGGGSLAVTAGASGSSGNWGATSLAQSATWGAGGSTGGFSWSLPFDAPTALAGPAPQIGLSYSSAASDGRTPNSNNQSGLIGEGFDVTSSYVERSYVPCSQDEEGAANNVDRVSGDQCWGTENATLSFNGAAVELVHDVATNTWHGKSDDGSLVEKLTGAWNGGQANEYWKVTTTDGIQYFFGRGQRSETDTTALNSAWTVPVYGNHPGEPCYSAAFSDSRCNQVWRWNLEYVVDPSGNSMTYFYSKESNSYVYDIEGNNDGNIVSYNSGGRLDRIEYGTRAGSESTATAPAKITFTTSPRCITDLANPDSWCGSGQTSTTSNHWLDTPVDLVCSAEPCTNYTPVFFDRYRLNDVSTFAYDATGYKPVDSWSIAQRFVASGTSGLEHAASPMLITTGVTHTGKGGTSELTDDLSLLPHQFGYAYLDNRVDSTADGVDPLRRPRISVIRTETGASVTVNYRTECSSTDKPGTSETAQQANTKLCYPVKWAESDYADAKVEYFHKYVVETIVESGVPPVDETGTELITGSLATETSFTYGGGAAWAKPTGAMVKADELAYSDFRGFEEVTMTLGVGAESSSSKTLYFRGMGGTLTAGPPGHVVVADDTYERKGSVFAGLVLNGTALVSQKITVPTYEVTATNSEENTASMLSAMETFEFTYGAPTVLQPTGVLQFRTGSKTVYNASAQPVTFEDFGNRDIAADSMCTTITYAHATNATLASKRLVALAAKKVVVKGSCSGTPDLPADLISSTTTAFDDFGRPVQSSSIDPTDGDGDVLISEVQLYDDRGRALRTADALGHISTFSYQDSAQGLRQATTTTSPDPDDYGPGNNGPLSGFVTTSTFNPLTGWLLSTTDMNGRVSSATYDSLGRLLTVRYPQHQSSGLPSVQYEYEVQLNGLNSVVTKTLGADGAAQNVAVTLYDGLLRPFQTQVESVDAGADHNAAATVRGRLVSDVYYDSAGRVDRQTDQWLAAGAPEGSPVYSNTVVPSVVTFEYDSAGRTTDEILWVGNTERWRTVTDYDGKTTLTVPPMGGTPKAVESDARGRMVKLTEYLRDPDVDASADSAEEVRALSHQSTTYVYRITGQLIEMRDPALNLWSYEYDWAGRQIGATDPDAGTSSTTYDLAGRTLTHTNGNGETLAYTYDPLGRKTTLRDDSPTTGAVRVQWQYDQATDPSIVRPSDPTNHNVLGQMSSATRFVDGAAYVTSVPRYDEANRPLETTVTLPNIPAFAELDSRTFSTSYTYMADGQVASVSLPAVSSGGVTQLGSEIVTTRYDTAGMPSWMSGGFGWGAYVAESRFASDGRQVLADLGNTYGEIVSYGYEDGTKRLINVSLDREGVTGTEVNLIYTYDAAGNVVSIKDQPTAASVSAASYQDNQCFGFDGLRRLQLAFTAVGGDCSVASNGVTLSEVGGVAPYWSDYSYDALGNRTQLVEHATSGAASTATTTYTHGAGGAAPHQVTGVSKITTGGTTTTSAFSYDDAGNRESVTSNGETVDYLWDAEGELAGVDGEQYTYDASGNRLVRTDASGTTVYLPGGQEVTIGASSVSATRYYSFAGQTVAMRTGNGLAAVTSLVSDQHGSVVAAVANTAAPSTTAVQRVYSDPFGAARGGSGANVPGDHRFLGAVRDAGSGLTLLGARYYDEAVGQFISVDPLLESGLPEQFNAYCYSGNNPVTFSDPSGLMKDPPGSPLPKKSSPPTDSGKTPLDGIAKTPAKSLAESLADALYEAAQQPIQDALQGMVDEGGATAATQHPDDAWKAFYDVLGFDLGDDGVNTTQGETWQLYVGYCPLYDFIFGLGVDMEANWTEATFGPPGNEQTVALWGWKGGSYLAMGPGGELGWYTKPTGNPLADLGAFLGFREVDKEGYVPAMSVSIARATDAENPVVTFAPGKQSWTGAYASQMGDLAKEDIIVTLTVDLSDNDAAFDAFNSLSTEDKNGWTFNTTTRVGTLKLRRKKRSRIR